MNPRQSNSRRRWLLLTLFFGILAVGMVNYVAVAGLTFSFFYALLVGAAVIVGGRAPGVAAAALAVLTWMSAEVFAGQVSMGADWVPIWNAIVRFGYLTLVVIGADYFRRVRAGKSGDWNENAPPLCTCCQRLREPAGAWVDFESFLIEQYEIRPEHKICPDCAKRLYAERVAPKEVQDTSA